MTEKASNVVLNFKMDGQVEYAKTIRDINAIMNAAASEYKTHVAAMGQDATATQKLAAEKKKLEIQLEAGRKRTEQLRTEYDAMAKSTKTTTGQLAAKHNQLMNSERAEISLANALDKVNQEMSDQAEESRKAEQALNKLEAEAGQLESQTAKLNAEFKHQESQLAENAKESEKLSLQMDHLNKSHELAIEKVKNYEEQLEQAKKQYGENATEVDKYEVQLIEARTAEQQLANEISSTNKKLKEQEDVLANTSKKLKETGDKMKDVGKDLSMKVTAPIVAVGTVATKSAIDFESAFAGVRKTVDATEEEFADLSDEIRGMAKEIPAAATEIAGVAEAAGQLGIKKEAILGFTETMVNMGVATNMTSEEAATALARLANITQMSQEDFDRLGSSVVDLGNNFATTESEIIDMALRLAGAGAQVGMSEADILALAAALSSVGIEAEMGGSAISRVMVSMQVATSTGFTKVQELLNKTGYTLRDLQMMASHSGKAFGNLAEDLGMTKKELSTLVDSGVDLEGFSSIAGMTGEQFKKAFEEDAIGALGAFIEGLANAEEVGESAINMLQEMGITEIRLRDSLLRAGGASELFANAVKLSNEAWVENNALSKEAEERYKTTASQLTLLKNNLVDIGIDIGNILIPMLLEVIEAIRPWIERFQEMDESSQKVIVMIAGLVAAIPPLLWIIGSMATGISALITAFTTVSGAIAVVTTGAAAATPAIGALASVITFLTGPIGLAIAAIGVMVASGIAWYKNFEALEEKIGTTATVIIGLLNPLTSLSTAIKIFQRSQEDAIEPITRFGDEVSESTQKAVGAFMDMSEQADVALKELAWSQQTVTKEMAANMKEDQQEITDTLLSAVKERFLQEKEESRNQMAELDALSDEKKRSIIEKLNERYREETAKIEEGNAAIAEIYQRAANNNRYINESEANEILAIRQSMTEQAVVVMSENETEQRLIYERMKDNASDLSALEAAEVVKNSVKKKEDVITEAQDQYTQTRMWAEQQRDELGTLSIEEAEDIILAAQKKRDETIKNAEEMHEKVVSEAKTQAEEHVEHVDWETGEILTKWEVFKNKTKETLDEMKASGSETWKKYMADIKSEAKSMKEKVEEKFEELKKGAELTLSKVPGVVKQMLVDALVEVAKMVLKFVEAGEDVAEGLINGMKSKAAKVGAEAASLGIKMIKSLDAAIGRNSPAKEFIAAGMDAGDGIVIGLQNSEDAVAKASAELGKVMTDVARKNAEEYGEIADKAEKDRTAIQEEYAKKRIELERKTSQTIQSAMRTSKNKKDQLTAAGSQRIHNTRADAAAKLRKLEEDEQKKLAKINEKAWANMVKKENELSKQRLDAVKLYVQDKKSLEELSLVAEAMIWEQSLSQFKAGTKERVEAQKAYQKAVESINKELVSNNKNYADQMQKVNDDLVKQIDDLNKVYDDAFTKKENFYRNQVGLFDDIDLEMKQSGTDLLNTSAKQLNAMKTWQEQMELLAKKGIDEGLLAELREMGIKALPQLTALNQMTDEQLTQYSEIYQEKAQWAREQTEAELIGLKMDTEDQIAELRKAANKKLDELQVAWIASIRRITQTTNDEFKSLESIGRQAGQNLLDGLTSMEGALIAKARSIAAAVNAAMSSALGGSGSSSRSMNTMSIDTQWNAKGGIFTQPTIFGASGGKLQGAGEAGPEAVLPLNDETLGAIGKGIAKAMGGANITINSRDDAESIARAVDRVQRRYAYQMG